MILIALIFAVIIYAEIRYLRKKKEKLTPYIIIYSVLFLASEFIFMFRNKM
jgi:membrane-anchored protein YejM (alkaline phosphatase superfamily)